MALTLLALWACWVQPWRPVPVRVVPEWEIRKTVPPPWRERPGEKPRKALPEPYPPIPAEGYRFRDAAAFVDRAQRAHPVCRDAGPWTQAWLLFNDPSAVPVKVERRARA